MLLLVSLLSPVLAVAGDNGKKHFREGIKHEDAQVWDKAVEEFALAVADSPKNPEYRLHLTRALFNASQMFMKKGTTAANEKDFQAGYVAFRRAYAYDPTNELAKSEMDRMVRMQQAVNEGLTDGKKADPNNVNLITTGYVAPPVPAADQVPQKLEKLRDLPFPSGVDLQFIVKELARDLDLNVLFDVESFRPGPVRKTNIDLKNVSAARALDYIFLQEGLFFQKVGPRTIIVATQAQRQKFQQLVLRTFYLANAAPKDIVKIVQTAIPPQPGRSQTIVLQDEATNSVTIRDTQENIALIGQLIKSLDKDRAEVVMDVAIYEVNKSDLLQIGNQIGSQSSLTNLGLSQGGGVRFGSNPLLDAAGVAMGAAIPTGLILPAASLAAFQRKNDTKLLAFSQIHAFNNEDSSARIGQRVPVQTASILNGNTGGTLPGFGQTANVINYEQTGLTLKFKPIVFPNQDVQVAMEIESKDVAPGGTQGNPIFTERTIKGTARIQNNKTLLLASVAQDIESRGREGLPFLGLIPIIGRLFTAPTRDNRQIDIVIAVTPRVIRAPAILPEDLIERNTGSLAVPTNGFLSDMIAEEDRQELLAAARRIPNNSVTQLPDQPVVNAPEYVKTTSPVGQPETSSTTVNSADMTSAEALAAAIPNLKPTDNSAKTINVNQISVAATPVAGSAYTEVKTLPVNDNPDTDKPLEPAVPEQPAGPTVELSLGGDLAEMKAGDKIKIPVMIQSGGVFRSATMGLTFDDKKLAVRSVSFGDVFGAETVSTAATPFLNQNGRMYISLISKDGRDANPDGTLAFIEIEALTNCKPEIAFDRDVLSFLTGDGKNFHVKFMEQK